MTFAKPNKWAVGMLLLMAGPWNALPAEESAFRSFIKRCNEQKGWTVKMIACPAGSSSPEGGLAWRLSYTPPGLLRAESGADKSRLLLVVDAESKGWVYRQADEECEVINEAAALKVIDRLSLALPLVVAPDRLTASAKEARPAPVVEMFDGVQCAREDLEFDGGRLSLWLETRADGPLLRGAEWNAHTASAENPVVTHREVYREWSFGPTKPGAFVFVPPSNAHVIDALTKREPKHVPPIKVPSSPGRLTRDMIARQQSWMERQLTDRFAARHRGEPWLEEAKSFLKQAVPFLCLNATKNEVTGSAARPTSDLKQAGRDLIARGCDDAVFCFAVAAIDSFRRNASKENADLLMTRLNRLSAADDPAAIKALALGWLWQSSYAGEREARNREIWDACVARLPDLIVTALEQCTGAEDSLCLCRTLYGKDLRAFIVWGRDQMKQRIANCKGAPWVVDTLLGDIGIEDAWEARGSGWASTVTEEGWKGFFEHLSYARQRLVRAWQARPDAPWAACNMITVTTAGHGVPGLTERDWFDRATSAVFDHSQAYYSMFWALRPRWGGSHEQMLEFAKACADTKRYDTIVPSRLFNAVKNVAEELSCMDEVHGDPDLGRRIVGLQQAMLDAAKSDTDQHYLRSFLVANAFLAHDYDASAKAWSELKHPMHEAATARLSYFGKPSLLWQGTLALHAIPEGFKHFLEGEDLYRAHDLKGAKKAFQLARTSGGEKAAKPGPQLLSMRLAAIAVEERLAKGGWVKLLPGEQRTLWLPQTGNWWNFPDGSISFRNERDDAEGRVILNARIGLDFEVRGHLEVSPELDHPQIGVTFAFQWDHNGFASAVAGVTSRKPASYGAALVPMAYDSSEKRPLRRAQVKPDSTFRLRIHEGTATLWIDDHEIFADSAQDLFKWRDPWHEKTAGDNLFGFGSNYFSKGETRIKDIEFRRLDVPDSAEGAAEAK